MNIEPTINNITTSAAIVRGLYYSPILTSLTGTTHRAIETTTGDVLFNTTSGNVGINTTAPTAKLYVKAGGALSTDLAFRVRNSADTGDLMLVNGLGNVGIGKSPSYPLDIAITNAGNLLSGMYVTGIHSDGRSALYGVANTSTERLLYWWHNGGIAVGTGGSTKGGAVSYIGDRSYYGPAHSMYFMETVGGGFGPTNVKYRLGITTSTTNTSFESGVSNNLTNIESNTFTFTAKSHTFYTGTTAGNTSLPNQYIALHLSTTGEVGIGTITPNATSILELASTTKGFLPPRMTNAQRIAIATPAVGLCVYCTDVVEGLYINKSTGWTYIG